MLYINGPARSISAALLQYAHLSWGEDAIKVKLSRHKGDQDGSRSYDKHVYANPFDPVICPFVHLGVKIICTYKSDNCDNNVFTGANTESKFSKWLKCVLSTLGETAAFVVGFAAIMLGTHSFRKGAATYGTSFVGGPTTVSVFNRAEWSIGNVQQSYIFPTESADQMLGRVWSGLRWGDCKFAVLPLHFKSDLVFNDEEWNLMVPGYQNYPNCFKAVVPYLIALVVHNIGWLRDNLPESHPFFQSRFYTSGIIERLKSGIILCYSYCPDSRMSATGNT